MLNYTNAPKSKNIFILGFDMLSEYFLQNLAAYTLIASPYDNFYITVFYRENMTIMNKLIAN